jgi:cyclophilin family peptidyl-prolyl cis-trans isomerase
MVAGKLFMKETLNTMKFVRPLLAFAAAVGVAVNVAAQTPQVAAPKATEKSAAMTGKPQVEMKTSIGTIVIELDPAAAPKTVENFLEYVKSGFYEGTIYHRIIKNFMAQGGGFDKAMAQKPTRAPVTNEAEQAEKAGIKNDRGTIAMARTNDPHSATGQFFINYKDNTSLNASTNKMNVPPQCKAETPPPQCKNFGWGYTAFGKVVSGMDIVDKMAEVPTGSGGPFPSDVPQTQIVIEKVTLKK